MTSKSDQEFEDYLNGNSEISQLYSQSKTGKMPEKLANSIKEKARERKSVSSIAPVRRKSQQKVLLPFAMAATIVLAIGTYWAVVPQSMDQQQSGTDVALIDTDTINKQTTENPQSIENIDITPSAVQRESLVGTLSQEKTLTGTPQVVNAQLAVNQESAKVQEKLEKVPAINIASIENAEMPSTSSSNNPKPFVEPTLGNKLLATEVASKKEKEALDNRLEEADEDTDYSLDWMNRLAVKKTDTASVTKTVSSSLTPQKWIKDISLLHQQNKHKEAKKSLSAFRKLYPRYKLPLELQEAYETQ